MLGYDQGVMAGLIGSAGTPFTITFNDPDATTLGLMVGMCSILTLVRRCNGRAWLTYLDSIAIYEIGCFAGACVCFLWGESFSRRTWMMVGVVVMIVGATLQTASQKMSQLIAGRIVTGLVNIARTQYSYVHD